MSFPHYPKYTPRGVEWLWEVPEHWRTGSLRWLARRFSGGTPDRETPGYWLGGTIPWLNSGAVNDRFIREPSEFITHEGLEHSSAKWIPRGSLVIALAGQGKTKGMVAQVGFETTCNQSMAALLPGRELVPRFLFWWLDSQYQNVRNMAGGDLRDGLNLDLLGSIACPLPPITEQLAIAAFLDQESAKIDALVVEQERLMELLNEKRQAVISHAVTKGLDPTAPTKPSGIEWLGDVPSHWEVSRLEHFCDFVWGKAHEPFIDEAGAHVCVTARFVSTDGETARHCTENLTPARKGDILMVMSDLPNGRALARAFLVRDDRSYAVNQRVCAVHPRRGDSRYFLYQLNRNRKLLAEDDGANQTHLSNHDFAKLPVLVPPESEQRAIADVVEGQLAVFNGLADEAGRAVELLLERRSALISAAVIGQIDVRSAVPVEAA